MSKQLPADVRKVVDQFPGISLVRAHQIARDRAVLRRRAAKQARRNLYGPVDAGGLGPRARAVIAAIEEAR